MGCVSAKARCEGAVEFSFAEIRDPMFDFCGKGPWACRLFYFARILCPQIRPNEAYAPVLGSGIMFTVMAFGAGFVAQFATNLKQVGMVYRPRPQQQANTSSGRAAVGVPSGSPTDGFACTAIQLFFIFLERWRNAFSFRCRATTLFGAHKYWHYHGWLDACRWRDFSFLMRSKTKTAPKHDARRMKGSR